MVEAIKRDNKLLLIPLTMYMRTPWSSRKKKSLCWEKHLIYFKGRNKELNEM